MQHQIFKQINQKFIEQYQVNYQILQFSKPLKKSMDSHPFYRYADSQDHLIISLNEQIQSLVPLKESYAAVQRYHIKITQDLQSLLIENDQVSEAYCYKIKELGTLNDELDSKKTRYVDEIRKMENEKAKLVLERKNLMCACETLGSKFNLQNQQNLLQQDRARDLIDTTKKTQHGIQLYRKVINQLQNELRMKGMEKNELEEEIRRKMMVNQKLTRNCENDEKGIEKMETENKCVFNRNTHLQDQIHQTEAKIRQQILRGKGLSEDCIRKKQELSNLFNQKQYYCRLIQSQMMIKEDLEISSQKLGHLLQKRTQQLNKMNEENVQARSKIEEEESKMEKNNRYKEAMKKHLAELIQSNCQLLQEMERYCGQDKKVHKFLNDKVNRLQVSCDKVRNNREPKYEKPIAIFKDRINQGRYEGRDMKMAGSTGKTWINELKDIENMQLK